MTRTGLLISCLICLGLAACAADTRSPDPRDPGDPAGHPSQTMHGVILTASAPRQDVAIAAQAPAATTLTVTIAAIDDPSGQPFSLAASVVWSGAGTGGVTEEVLGSVTPYPASQPGSFVIGVPEAARRSLSRGDGQLTLRVALQPIDAARPLAEPLRVTLGDPAWH